MSNAPLLTPVSTQPATAPRAVAMALDGSAWVLEQLRARHYTISDRTGEFVFANDFDLMNMVPQPRDLAIEASGKLLVAGDGGLMRCDPLLNTRFVLPGFSSLVSVACRGDGAFAVATASLIKVYDGSGTFDFEFPETGVLRLDWDANDYLHVATATSVRVYILSVLHDEYGLGDHTGIRSVANDPYGNSFVVDDGHYLTAYVGLEYGRRYWLQREHNDVALVDDRLVACSTLGNLVVHCYLDYQSRGPRGLVGPSGPQGPQGPAGSAGGEGDASLFHHMILGGM